MRDLSWFCFHAVEHTRQESFQTKKQGKVTGENTGTSAVSHSWLLTVGFKPVSSEKVGNSLLILLIHVCRLYSFWAVRSPLKLSVQYQSSQFENVQLQ